MMKFGRCLLLVSMLPALSMLAGPDERSAGERANQWELAASDRELAGAAQERHAAQLLDLSVELKRRESIEDGERRSVVGRAGESERTAGDALAAAFVNYDKASTNWLNAAEEYRRLKDDEKEKTARGKAEQSKVTAAAACVKTCEAYELSAESFGSVGDLAKEAIAAEKAAQFREVLAARK